MKYWITEEQLELLAQTNPEYPEDAAERDELIADIRSSQKLTPTSSDWSQEPI